MELNQRDHITDLLNINFPMLEYTNQELTGLVHKIIGINNCVEEFKISKYAIRSLVKDIAHNYNVIPYHHFTHAFEVFQVHLFPWNNPQDDIHLLP